MGSQYITREGLEKLIQKLEYLKTARRQEIASRIKSAKELGDLSENAEYQDAKDEQAFNEGQIIELSNMVKNAIIIDQNGNKDIVTVGSTVLVKNRFQEKAFTIVGSNEADPLEGRISNESPIGKALLGRKKGDEVMVMTPAGKTHYKILKIS